MAQSAAPQSSTQAAEDRAIAEKMLGVGGRVTPDRIRNRCANPTRPGEIVVCAPNQDQFRVPDTGDDPDQSIEEGDLAPADVGGRGIFRGKSTMSGMCMIPPCPPEAPYIIDLSSIPEAPEGSDADKIAKGEMRVP